MSAGRPLIIMGVAGAGKSTLGRAFADAARLRFVDGDDLHDAAARASMAAGRPLGDAERWPWLDRISTALSRDADIVACSALKRAYRERLRAAVPGLHFAFLDIDKATAAARIAARRGHFMSPALIASQFATLEPPGADEADVITLDASRTPADLGAELLAFLTAAR